MLLLYIDFFLSKIIIIIPYFGLNIEFRVIFYVFFYAIIYYIDVYILLLFIYNFFGFLAFGYGFACLRRKKTHFI